MTIPIEDLDVPRLRLCYVEDVAAPAEITVSQPRTAYAAFRRVLPYSTATEEFWAMYLDTRNRPIAMVRMSTGGFAGSVVRPREIFAGALIRGAAAMIVAHNHPSGDVTHSREDVAITDMLREAGELLGVRVLDHLIIATGPRVESWREFSSFREAGIGGF